MIRQVLRRTLRAGAQLNTPRQVRSLFTSSRMAASAMPVLQTQARSKLNFKVGGIMAAAAVAAGSVAYLDSPQQKTSPQVDYAKARAQIAKLVQEDDNRGPLFLRLAWHSSGTYDRHTKTGGSHGATMRYNPESNWGANSGLHHARELLEPVKRDNPNISYSDLWTLAGVVSIEEMGGPTIDWRPGRVDATSPKQCPPDGRLPDADKGNPAATVKHVRDIFYRMGFNDQEIVALIGAHTLGRCHMDRSGYHGPWTRAPTTFSNQFFLELLNNKWTKKNWEGPEQFEDPTGELMMLPADMVLLQDREFRKYVELYAKDEQLFFRDFAVAFKKLIELGVPFDNAMKANADAASPSSSPSTDAAAPAPAKKKSWWIF